MKWTRDVDVLVRRSEADVWTAQPLDHLEYASAGATRAEALAALEKTLLWLLRDDPTHIEPTPTGTLSARSMRLRIPVEVSGTIEEVEASLLLLLYNDEADPSVGVMGLLPQIDRGFHVRDPHDIEALEQLVLEHVRDWQPLRGRLDALLPMMAPLTLVQSDAGPLPSGALAELTKLTIRFTAKSRSLGGDSSLDGDEEQRGTLEAVAEPLHVRMARKDAPRAFERRAEVELMLNYLSEQDERSLVLVGPPGAGKTALVYEVVGRMARGEARGLSGTQVWQISGGRLMAGMRFLGQWQERLLKLIDEARGRQAFLFAENIIELLEAAGSQEYAHGIPGLLLPHLVAGDLVLITEARPEQLAWAEQRHPSFVRALRRLPVDAMNSAQTDAVLDRLGHRLGREHNVKLEDATRGKILELTARFRGATVWPAPAAELAERMARTAPRPAPEPNAAPPKVSLTPALAIDAWASITGMPRNLLDPDLDFSVEQVRASFEGEVFDQPDAADAMTELVTVLRAGLNSPGRPLGSYLFLGPTGVGKTQTALTLAKYLFGSADRLLRFDMSEYQDAWAAGRLVGRVRGEHGELVKKLREQPFQVVLLDEIEKADGAVFDLLLQALGEGRLTDAYGQTVSLTSAVVIMTSNLGSRGPASLGFGNGGQQARRAAEVLHYRKAVEEFFRPEFLGRIDGIIPFRSLDEGTARKLVERSLREAFEREGLVRRGIRVRAEQSVVDYLMRVGFDVRYGARPLRQAVEQHITASLAAFIARESYAAGLGLVFRMVDGIPHLELEDVFY
jgi:ATP-dependent Clp protease ATP-binding subunit ClpC